MKHIHLPGLLRRVWEGNGPVTWKVDTTAVVSVSASLGEGLTEYLTRDLRAVIGQVICSGGDWSARLVRPIKKDIGVRTLFKRRKGK